jgi:NAD kinase
MHRRVVILTRASARLQLERRYGTVRQAAFAMKASAKGEADFARAAREDTHQSRAVEAIRRAIPDEIKCVEIDRDLLAQFLFEPHDLVIAIGPDGLVANAGKYLDGQPIVGVNPDPDNIEGVLLPFTALSCAAALPALVAGERPHREATLAEGVTSDGQVLRGLNEIFVGVPNHQSARYRLRFGPQDEMQSSSGLIVATGTGSTGWLKSLLGASGAFDPAEPKLVFAVREAWPGKGFGASLIRGEVSADTPLVIESRMDAGTIFADGIEGDAVRFDAGMTMTVRPSERRVRLVG